MARSGERTLDPSPREKKGIKWEMTLLSRSASSVSVSYRASWWPSPYFPSNAEAEAFSQKIPQPQKLYYVLGGQNARNKRRLGRRTDFIQVPRCLGLSHELPDALIERAGSDRVALSIRTTLIVERRPFPQLSRGTKVDGEFPGHRSAPNRGDYFPFAFG
jgi:hypothetical protein